MKRLQMKRCGKILGKWLLIGVLILAVFILYQRNLETAVSRRVISWIGAGDSEAFFEDPDNDAYDAGLQQLKEAGYEATGRQFLTQWIRTEGRIEFCLAVFVICLAAGFLDIRSDRRREEKTAKRLEAERQKSRDALEKEREFRQREQQKMGTYMENISHQLKTPIAGTLLQLEYLYEVEKQPKKRERLASCVKQVSRMSEMVIVLLRMAQIDSGKIWMKRKREDFTLLVRDCVERLQPQAGEREVALETELTEGCILSCDGFWIREAVSNVLKNAIEYAKPGSRVEVTLKQEQNRYELRISDHGRRLESSDREQIFERFYQMDGSKKNSFGIGLHLSREIIGLHQGTLTAPDTGEEKTTFLFLLPKLITKDYSQTERRLECDENSNQNGTCE